MNDDFKARLTAKLKAAKQKAETGRGFAPYRHGKVPTVESAIDEMAKEGERILRDKDPNAMSNGEMLMAGLKAIAMLNELSPSAIVEFYRAATVEQIETLMDSLITLRKGVDHFGQLSTAVLHMKLTGIDIPESVVGQLREKVDPIDAAITAKIEERAKRRGPEKPIVVKTEPIEPARPAKKERAAKPADPEALRVKAEKAMKPKAKTARKTARKPRVKLTGYTHGYGDCPVMSISDQDGYEWYCECDDTPQYGGTPGYTGPHGAGPRTPDGRHLREWDDSGNWLPGHSDADARARCEF